ncbi:GNAT family N-acetyltransferase [Sneathiella glossodoripedis]|uniref:GNAT family N-acetyltransferase n=1 Tax=Sneathiella glossodoripedis TaxID=418853 RepID=UPI000471CCF9|nr:GNAT family N-acetyltransferase [Sneathiella glossodoripedis]
MSNFNITSSTVDYEDPVQSAEMMALLQAYALDPMGGGKPLDEQVIERLPIELSKRPHAFSILVYVDGEAAGLANCFEGFSTFACAPLVNIHDLVVLPKFRGLGLSLKLLDAVEEHAIARDCCKITLEVLSENEPAKQAYLKFGFAPYNLDPEAGQAEFWQKPLLFS